MNKRLFSLVLVLCIVIMTLPFGADAADIIKSGTMGENAHYTLYSDGLLTISGSGAVYGDFPDYEIVKTVVIEPGITSISIPNGYSETFFGWPMLTSVTIPSSVTTIGNGAFNYCKNLKTITIPSNVTTIENNTFIGCRSLTEIKVNPDNPNYCDIEGVLFSKDQTMLMKYPYGKASTYQIPSCTKSIGTMAFEYCRSLESVTIPSSVTNIGYHAFHACSGLTSIIIPQSVTNIEPDAFSECDGLLEFKVDKNNPNYCDVDGVLFSKDQSTLEKYPCGRVGGYQIPSNVTTIGSYSFWFCDDLTSVIIPDSVTHFGYKAFCGCSGLESVSIPSSMTTISVGSFSHCTGLTSVIIPTSIIKIQSEAFDWIDCIVDVYYSGTKEQWDQIEIGSYNGALKKGVIHFNSSGPSTPISPPPSDEHYNFYPLVTSITCNEYGDKYLPVAVTDKNGKLVEDGVVFYCYAPGVDGKNIISSNGVVYIPFFGDDNEKAEFVILKYDSGTGKVVCRGSFTISTATKPLSYKEKIKTDLSLNGEGKLADFFGLSSTVLYGTGFEYEEDNGAGKLTLSNKISGKIGGKLETPKKLIASVEGSGKITAEEETTLTIESFDPKSALHKGLIGYYLLQQWNFGKVTQTELANSFREMYGVDPDGYKNKTTKEIATVKVDADVPILKTLLGDLTGGYDITSPGGALTYESSVKHEPGVSETYTSKIKADFHGFLSKGPWLMGISSTIFCKDMDGRSIAVTAKDYLDDSKDSISFSSDAYTSDVVAGWTEKDTTVSKVTFSGETAKSLYHNNYVIPSLLKGTAYFLTPNELRGFMTRAEDIMKADPINNTASYSEEVKYTSDFEYSFGSGSDGTIDTYVGLKGSGEKEYTIPTKTGVVFNGDKYLTTDTSFPEGTTWNLGYSVPDLFALYADGLLSFFGKCVVTEAGKVVDGVVEGAAKVWGKVSDKWDVVISSANIGGASVESFSPDDGARVMLADENGDQASVIDHAYTVRIFEDTSHEKEVSADTLKANPVSLTFDLSGESSVITSNLEKATIYHWDETCQSYKPAPNQTRDQAKKTISCDVTENGEYVVAIDDTAPDVRKVFYMDEGNPEIVAVVNDFSEIANLTLEIDGAAVVSGDQYSSYYDVDSGVFRYPLKSNEAGDYKASLTVTDAAGNKTEKVIQYTIGTTPTPSNPFTDVKESAYYFEPVLWAVNHVPQITNGTGDNTFSPEWECQRCQIVTFLWRAMGCPEPTSTNNPFVDVKPSDYFYKPVLWAVEKGITNGMDLTHFDPLSTCTRGQAVTFLWRAEGRPAPRTQRSEFTDVQNPNDYFYTPVLWAVENGITNGTGNGLFSPNMICLREQIVTFLYRDLA